LHASLFSVPKMDCPSEEGMIRLALRDAPGLTALEFDLGRRQVRVLHEGPVDPLGKALTSLGLGATLLSTAPVTSSADVPAVHGASPEQEAFTLRTLLAINAAMFVVELAAGWLAQSTGLIADSLDMFADAAVYGIALYAVGRDVRHQKRAARVLGWLQATLALGAMAEVVRRFAVGSEPEAPFMMGIACLALVANVSCLLMIYRHREGGIHMKASWICSTNDVLANVGVIVAGALVAWTGTNYPDLVIGTLIAGLVLDGARRILRLRA
jgi:Co/Zn/Cd efflux system component